MDATRSRRTRDDARQCWYAQYRCRRLARHLRFFGGPIAEEGGQHRPCASSSLGRMTQRTESAGSEGQGW